MTKCDDLWVRVMHDKYRCGDDLFLRIDVERVGSD